MRIDILTLFPEMFAGPLSESMIKRARERGLVDIRVHDIREFAHDKHRTADDRPFGGGPGMVLKPEPIFECFEAAVPRGTRLIYMTPQGRPLTQAKVRELAAGESLALLCGHYEGVDERVRAALVTEEISIGDYVLTGGELPAMVLVDAVVRLLPGALGDEDSAQQESFTGGLLDCPHFTRPEVYRGMAVPQVLLSGNHGEIARWRRAQAEERTRQRRPDLIREDLTNGDS
jgi:tRNA (guanine37-N1)-methyltransferase